MTVLQIAHCSDLGYPQLVDYLRLIRDLFSADLKIWIQAYKSGHRHKQTKLILLWAQDIIINVSKDNNRHVTQIVVLAYSALSVKD